MPELKIRAKNMTVGDGIEVTQLFLSGFINSSTFMSFENILDVLLQDENTNLVIDFGDVNYINSSGMSTILSFYNSFLAAGKELVLANVSPQVRLTMQLLGLTSVVPLFPDATDAQDYFLSGPVGQRSYADFVADREEVAEEEEEERPAKAAPPREIRTLKPETSGILMVYPREDRFTDITRLRLFNPKGKFLVVRTCKEALRIFDDFQPDLVILEDKLEGSEEFLTTIKMQRGKSVVPIIKLYLNGTDIGARVNFKIWEDDYLVEPFEMMELFALGEAQLRRIPEDRNLITHHTHFQFRTTPENVESAAELTRSLFEQAGLRGDSFTAINAAVSEAVDNAVRHGHQSDPSKCIDVIVLVDSETVAVTVEDEGKGFDYGWHLMRVRGEGAPPGAPPSTATKRGGLGIPLMYKCTDVLEYLGNGNIVRLEKSLDGEPPPSSTW